MLKYIIRLVKCGFTVEEACQDCCDFMRDFSLFELENFVSSMEMFNNVGTV
jgi:hypothetical protein